MLKFKTPSNEEPFDLIQISTKTRTEFKDESVFDKAVSSSDIIDEFVGLFRSLHNTSTANELKMFLFANSIWNLLSFPDDLASFELVKSNLVHMYFSIPDRVTSVCKLDTDEFFFPNSFASWTENSLLEAGTSLTTEKVLRFMPALKRCHNFGLPKLSKFPEFWDCIDSRLLKSLDSISELCFLSALFQNLAAKHNCTFKLLAKLVRKICSSLEFDMHKLAKMFMTQLVVLGSMDYNEFSRILSAVALLDSSNEFLVSFLNELLIKTWANDAWIIRTPFASQLHYSSCLMFLLSIISPDIFSSEAEEALMNGVQSRFDHSDPQIRLIATCIAETLNHLRPGSESILDFSLDPTIEVVKHLKECYHMCGKHIFDTFPPLRKDDARETFCAETSVTDETKSSIYEDEDDLKPISELIKEDLVPPKNAKVKLPRFLPESLKLLRANEDAELVEMVLTRLGATFSDSSKLTKQLHAISAFQTALSLANHFEINNFEHYRMDSMKLVLLDQIRSVGPELVECMFKSNKLVLDQKMDLLVVISAASQQIFSKQPQVVSSFAKNSMLEFFEKSFLISENSPRNITPDKNQMKNDFLEHLCIPMLNQSIRHFQHFKRNHIMFLEKFLWLQGIVLNFFQHSLKYDRLVDKYLDLLHLTLKEETLLCQVPLQKAILIGTSVALTAWPEAFSVMQYYPKLKDIYAFVDRVVDGPGFAQDAQLQALTSSVTMALQDLTDPQRLLRESTERMEFDLKSIKVTHL